MRLELGQYVAYHGKNEFTILDTLIEHMNKHRVFEFVRIYAKKNILTLLLII